MKLDVGGTKTDRVLAAAFGPDVYVIGGPVRDKLRELFHGVPFEPKDKDYVVVGATVKVVQDRLGSFGRLDAVGASFGVLKLTVDDEPTVDVALPRRERSTGWGHKNFEVDSGPHVTLEEDQGRRDFLMNAVAVQLTTGTLIEHPGALDDIRARRITAINGRQTFLDDPLRMLRAAQFAARIGFDIEETTLSFMTACSALVKTISPERIAEELTKLLVKSEQPSRGIRILHQTGILQSVIPGVEQGAGVEQNSFHRYDVLDHNLATLDRSRPDLVARWVALLHDIGKPATQSAEKGRYGYTFYSHDHVGAQMTATILRDLRYTNDMIDRAVRLVENHMYLADPTLSDATLKRFINRIGVDHLDDQFHLRFCDRLGSGVPSSSTAKRNAEFERRVRDILARKPPLSRKDLAVDGHDVLTAMAAALAMPVTKVAGPRVGKVLKILVDRVIDDPDLNVRDRLHDEMLNVVDAVLNDEKSAARKASGGGVR